LFHVGLVIWPHFCFVTLMKKLLICASVITFAAACNNESKESTEKQSFESTTNTPANENASLPPGKECYMGNAGRDTVTLSVNKDGDKVRGELSYRFYQKDKSRGSIDGWLKGDTLIADYAFASEGTESVRQVIFLKNGDTFTEGYADQTEKNGRMIFKNLDQVKFGDAFLLRKVECDK
jgi:hypothetical protein